MAKVPHRPLLLAVALTALVSLCFNAKASSPCDTPPPDPETIRFPLFSPQTALPPLSLSPASVCSDSDLSDWLVWKRAQPVPGTPEPPSNALPPPDLVPTTNAYPRVSPSAATLLRVAPPPPGSTNAPIAAIRYSVYILPSTNDYPVLLRSDPLFSRPPDFTENLVLHAAQPPHAAIPADIPLPSLLQGNSNFRSRNAGFAVRATLFPLDHSDPKNNTVILPIFLTSHHPADAYASSDLSADTWKRLADISAAPLPVLPADDSPVILDTHSLILSPGALSDLASRPRLAQRLLLAGADLVAPESPPANLPGTPLADRSSVLFHAPSQRLPEHGYSCNPPLASIEPTYGNIPALPDPSPLADAYPIFFLRAWPVFLLSALILLTVLLVIYRRAPSRRTSVWLILPLLALLLAVIAYAIIFLLPRQTFARHVILRIGAADFPEQITRVSSRVLRFRPAPLRFAYPAPDARIATADLSPLPRLKFYRTFDNTILDIPATVPAAPFTVEAAYFSPAAPPPVRAVRTSDPATAEPLPPDAITPETRNLLALSSRHLVADRDAADAWLYLAGSWYHIGPLKAGQTVFPEPSSICDLDHRSTNPAPFAEWIDLSGDTFRKIPNSGIGSFIGGHHLPDGFETALGVTNLAPADIPWLLLAREDALPSDAPPELPLSPRATVTTLWLNEFP